MITQSPGTIFGRMYILWSDIRTWAYVLKIFDRNLIKIKKKNEYAPYHFVDTEQAFRRLVKGPRT